MFNTIKKIFTRKHETIIENITGELTRINAYSNDTHPVILAFKMEYSDGDKQDFKFGLTCSDAEFLIQRMQYLISGISDIDGIDFNTK